MVPGSRINHNNGNPSTIEIQVYHFSAVQAAGDVRDATTTSILEDEDEVMEEITTGTGGGGGGGCFIGTTTASNSNDALRTNQGNENPNLPLTSVLAAVMASAFMRKLRIVERVYINRKQDRTRKGKEKMNRERRPGSFSQFKRL